MTPQIPLALSNARTAAQAMYRKYSAQADLIEDGKSTDRAMLLEMYEAVRLLEWRITMAYDMWAIVGGTSDIHSITALDHASRPVEEESYAEHKLDMQCVRYGGAI
jgi:hypothetical protein